MKDARKLLLLRQELRAWAVDFGLPAPLRETKIGHGSPQ